MAGQTFFTYDNGDNVLAAEDIAKVSCPIAPGTTFALSADNKSIVVATAGTPLDINYWTGEIDNDLSKGGNWSKGAVPSDNANIFCAGPAMLTKGSGTFEPTSITFLTNSAPVTIEGNFDTLTCVTNNSTVNQTFAGFVDFGEGNIDVTQTATVIDKMTVTGGCVVFAGGVKGNDIQNHTILTGDYELTKAGDFDVSSRITVNTDSSLSVKQSKETNELSIREGATFYVKDFTRGSNGYANSHRLWCYNRGAYIADTLTFTGGNNTRFWLQGYVIGGSYANANANSVLKIGTLTVNGDGSLALHDTGDNFGTTYTICIGAGGLNIADGKKGYCAVVNSNHITTMRPWNSDFTF